MKSSHKILSAVAALLLAAAFCSCSRFKGAGPLDFTLTNMTGRGIAGVYVSPHDSDHWEENLLKGEKLPTDSSMEIRFSPEEKVAVWDLRIESRAGYTAEWKGLNLREVTRITISIDKTSAPVAVAETE